MKLTALARGARGERGLTLTELLVTTTIIAVLAAVIATGVGGSVTTGNESSRSQLFDAVQKAVDGYASSHLPPDGELTKAQYPFARMGTSADTSAPFPGTSYGPLETTTGTGTSPAATVEFTTGTKPGKNDPANERVARDWYGADGKFLSPQPEFDTTTGTKVFVYVDLYSGGADCRIKGPVPNETADAAEALKGTYATSGAGFLKTDLRCLGSVALPGSAARSFGTPGTSGNVIRCLFASNTATAGVTDQKTGLDITRFAALGENDTTVASVFTSGEARAKAAVGTNKGKVLACRDADPAGTSK